MILLSIRVVNNMNNYSVQGKYLYRLWEENSLTEDLHMGGAKVQVTLRLALT